MSNKNILVIGEGETEECEIIDKLRELFFEDYGFEFENVNISYQYFGSHIYSFYDMYKELSNLDKEEYLDIIGLINEKYKKELESLSEHENRNDIRQEDQIKISKLQKKIAELKEIKSTNPQIFLFFDYDGQAQHKKYTDENIRELLDFFNEETENGKLYISYPMCQVLYDIKKDDCCSRTCKVAAKVNIHYKGYVAQNSDFKDIRKFTKRFWLAVSRHSLKKTGCMSGGSYNFPDDYGKYRKICNQENIFRNQLELISEDKIWVMSAFPFFLIDYFGRDFYTDIITGNNYSRILEVVQPAICTEK